MSGNFADLPLKLIAMVTSLRKVNERLIKPSQVLSEITRLQSRHTLNKKKQKETEVKHITCRAGMPGGLNK